MIAPPASENPLGADRSHRSGLGARILFGGIGLLWSAPFLWSEHRIPLTSLESELIAQVCLAIVLIAAGTCGRGAASARWPLAALLLGLTGLSLVQYLLGRLAYAQQLAAWLWVVGSMLVAYVVGRHLLASGLAERTVRIACLAAAGGAAVSVAIQLLQLFSVHGLPAWLVVIPDREFLQGRPFANMGQANHLATYLGAAALGVLCLHASGLKARWTALALVALGSGLGMAGSRMALLYAAVIALFVLVPNGLRPAALRSRAILIGALLCGFAIGMVAVRIAYSEADLTVLRRLSQDTYGLRIELWRQAWAISLQHPWLGAGAGQFSAAQYWVARASPYAQADVNCHNLLLQIAAEMGWPAALGVVAVALWWALSGLRARLRTPHGAFAWGFLALIAIHSMLEYPLWYLYFAIPAALLFALAEPESGREIRLEVQRTFPLIGLGLVAAALLMRVGYDRVAEASNRFWFEKATHGPISAEAVEGVMGVAQSRTFRPQGERLFIALGQPQDQKGEADLALSARVLSRLAQPEAIERHILLLAQAGKIEEAVRHVDRLQVFAKDRYPKFRDAVLEATADQGPALDPLRRALAARP